MTARSGRQRPISASPNARTLPTSRRRRAAETSAARRRKAFPNGAYANSRKMWSDVTARTSGHNSPGAGPRPVNPTGNSSAPFERGAFSKIA